MEINLCFQSLQVREQWREKKTKYKHKGTDELILFHKEAACCSGSSYF